MDVLPAGSSISQPLIEVMMMHSGHTLDVDENETHVWDLKYTTEVAIVNEGETGDSESEGCRAEDLSQLVHINNATGTLIAGSQLGAIVNYECRIKYVASITVTDTGVGGSLHPPGLSASGQVEIVVLDRNDPPKFNLFQYDAHACSDHILCLQIQENTIAGAFVGQLTATDPDIAEEGMTFSIEDNAMFNVLPSGDIVVSENVGTVLNYEVHSTQLRKSFTVHVRDSGTLAERVCDIESSNAATEILKFPVPPSELTAEQLSLGPQIRKREVQYLTCTRSSTAINGTVNISIATYGWFLVADDFNLEQLQSNLSSLLPSSQNDVIAEMRYSNGSISAEKRLCSSANDLHLFITFSTFPGDVPEIYAVHSETQDVSIQVQTISQGSTFYQYCTECDEDGGTEDCECQYNPPAAGATALHDQNVANICAWLGGNMTFKRVTATSTEAVLVIDVVDVNEPPILDMAQLNTSVEENAVEGKLLGRLIATDPDNVHHAGKQSLLFFMGEENARTKFTPDSTTGLSCNDVLCIDSIHGNVSVAEGAILDFEAQNNFSVTFAVQDSACNDPLANPS